ncbi:replication initiation protein [Candidatus Enterovibrio escicola]|uniref:replication initiation protein n=1 Tax=Candidatus Enterovibrio escicola TaxID=1927127 RepID=UPI001CC32848|nr:replication initiation protein [Candidatus Enterovibrio escacola]
MLGKKQRKLRPIPTINRKLWNTVEKVGVWVNVRWVFLVMRLVDAGMRKRNLEFRAVHLRNLENFLRWIAYNSDAVTGCINVSLLCVEIHREIGVSKSTIYLMIKELVIMRVLVDAEWSGQGCQDILHGGCLPRTLCATPLFYELMGIDNAELKRLRTYETERRCENKAKSYDAEGALRQYCENNIRRVWEHRHTQNNSSYRVKLSAMTPLSRLAYIAKNLRKRFNAKGWHINTDDRLSIKLANSLLYRMGLGVKVGMDAPPLPA